MKMMDQSEAFPRRVNFEQYQAIVDAAMKAAKGKDGLFRVVVEDYDTYKLAVKAANAIRNHAKANGLELRVSCPENSKSIFVVRGKPRARKTNASNVPIADTGTAAES
jgi:hypothetical protein